MGAGITMNPVIDRIPGNPGRVLIKPESGSADYYATIITADNPIQEGTPINKALFDSITAEIPEVTAGFSPTITENPDNTSMVYRLDITNEDGGFTTPNLKGMNSYFSLIAGFVFKLAARSLIDLSGIGGVVCSRIDSADSVNLISGMFDGSKVYI